MNTLMVVMRLIHIFSGVFWVGTSFFMVSFITPAVAATGAEGRTFMQHLALRTRLGAAMGATGGLTFLSGLTMWIYLFGDGQGVLDSPYALTITIGAAFGLAAFVVGFLYQNRATQAMKAIAEQIAASGGPPQPEQMAEMQRLGERIEFGSRLGALLMTGALVGMSVAQYVG